MQKFHIFFFKLLYEATLPRYTNRNAPRHDTYHKGFSNDVASNVLESPWENSALPLGPRRASWSPTRCDGLVFVLR